MNTAPDLSESLDHLKGMWIAFVAIGAALIALGVAALGAEVIATAVAVMVLGWLILIGGLLEAGLSLFSLRTGGFLLHLLCGILSIVIGKVILRHPLAAAQGLTMVLAIGWLISGVFRFIAAVMLRFPNWIFTAISGFVTAAIGVLIWSELPGSALWVIGTLIGIEMLFRGVAWITLGMTVRSLPEEAKAA